MQIDDFDYHLPAELIAQYPLSERTASRLLCIDPMTSILEDRVFSDLTERLNPGDLLVMNNTRVIPARLYGQKASGGRLELLTERILDSQTLLAHIKCSKSPKPGSELLLEGAIQCHVLRREEALFVLRIDQPSNWLEALHKHGHVPLPPYIERADEHSDEQRYQTVYAQKQGAVAAPTAGLHFDQPLLQRLEEQGVDRAFVTLHVGAGTFQPVRVDNIDEHVMHKEWVEVPDDTVKKIQQCRERGGRVVAVGTTVVRSLETASATGHLQAFTGDSQLFIRPGYQFRSIDALITNFHLPRSTLIMLVAAFAGLETIQKAYRHAIEQRYRFFSYGDAMLIERKHSHEI